MLAWHQPSTQQATVSQNEHGSCLGSSARFKKYKKWPKGHCFQRNWMSGSPGWHHANIVEKFWSCAMLVHGKWVKFMCARVSVRAHLPDSSESVMATPYRRHTWFLMVNSFRLHFTWGIWDVASCQRGDSGNTETQLMAKEQNKNTTMAISSHLRTDKSAESNGRWVFQCGCGKYASSFEEFVLKVETNWCRRYYRKFLHQLQTMDKVQMELFHVWVQSFLEENLASKTT